MEQEVKVEEIVALTLTAARATGGPEVVQIYPHDLLNSAIGKQWYVHGGGQLFDSSERATIEWRDRDIVGVLVESMYRDDQRDEVRRVWRVFSL